MPRISQFYGITIAMYYNDHAPPHFHAKYGGNEALIAFLDLEVSEGQLPKRALRHVLEWAEQHQQELLANWERARNGEMLAPIDPLE